MDIRKSLSDIRRWDVEIAAESVFSVAGVRVPDDRLAKNDLIYAGRLEFSKIGSTGAISFVFDGEVVR